MTNEQDIKQAEWRGSVIGKLDRILERLDDGVKRMDKIEEVQNSRPCADNTLTLKTLTRLAWASFGTACSAMLLVIGAAIKFFLGQHS